VQSGDVVIMLDTVPCARRGMASMPAAAHAASMSGGPRA